MTQHRSEDIFAGTEKFEVDVVGDGTLTQVQIIDEDGEVVGEGTARRMKGDSRNQDLGLTLAAARAFQDAATFYLDLAKEYGYVNEKPKASVNLTPAIQQAAKASNAFDKFVRELRYALRRGEKVG